MSYAEDQHWFGMEDCIDMEEYYKQSFIPNTWETKDGKLISISQMTTSHIQNSLKMIQRSNYEWRGSYYNPLMKELKKRIITKYIIKDTENGIIKVFDNYKSASEYKFIYGNPQWQIIKEETLQK